MGLAVSWSIVAVRGLGRETSYGWYRFDPERLSDTIIGEARRFATELAKYLFSTRPLIKSRNKNSALAWTFANMPNAFDAPRGKKVDLRGAVRLEISI